MTRLVRVGVADSGINPRDRQVGGVVDGIGIRLRDGRIERDDSWEDLLGHGTAVAATIRGHAASVELYAVRIFRRRLEARVDSLLAAIEWGATERVDLLNLSLGCSNLAREEEFLAACAAAFEAGVTIVSASEVEGNASLPGIIPGVIGVRADFTLEENGLTYDGETFRASPWARRRGELPRERNFHGTSFAVANVTGIAARLLSEDDRARGRSVRESLVRLASQ